MIWTTRPRSEGAGALHFFEEGEGPLLVMIHGVGLRAEAWSALVPVLSKRFRVVCVDMPGHGSTPLRNTASLEDYCTRLTQFLAELPIPVFLAGHSMGALLALELAARHPRKVAGVAALNAIFRRDAKAAQAVRIRAKALANDSAPDPEPTLQRWFGLSPSGGLQLAEQACRFWLNEGERDGYATAYRIFAHHDGVSDDTLRDLSSQALFITGALDPNSTVQMSQNMAALCPKGRAVAVPDAAHMLPMTHPDAVGQAILQAFAPLLTARPVVSSSR